MVSLSPLKMQSGLKDVRSYFQMEFDKARVSCEYFNKDEDNFFLKKNVYYKFKFYKLRHPLDLGFKANIAQGNFFILTFVPHSACCLLFVCLFLPFILLFIFACSGFPLTLLSDLFQI